MKQNFASYFSIKCLYILICALLYNIAVEGNKFHVQVLPAEYSWNVSVRCKDCYDMNFQNTDGSGYLTFDVKSYNNKGIKQLKVTIESNAEIKNKIRSNYGAFEESMLAMAEKANTETKFTKEIEVQIENAHLVAEIPENSKKYFASISGFEEEIELSHEQFYGFEQIRIDLMGKTSKPILGKTLSSLSSKNLLRKGSTKSLTPTSKKPSAIEKYIENHKNPELTVRIYMKVKCAYKHNNADFFAKDVVYKIDRNDFYHCKSCKKDYMNHKNVYHSPTIEKYQLPSFERTIKNPILQNGNGFGFTYTFDFGEKQDMKINLNFVQLVDVPPDNFHNESTSSHVPEYVFQTPSHPTYVSTNFHHLNLRDEDDGSGGSETERTSHGLGKSHCFDKESSGSGSSGKKKKASKPPKGNHKMKNEMEHRDTANTHKAQPKLDRVHSMPVPRGPAHDSDNFGHASNKANHYYNDTAMQYSGSSQTVTMNVGMGQNYGHEHFPSEARGWQNHPANYDYHPEMYGSIGGPKAFYRSESMPVNNQNGGDYTGRHSFSPQHYYGSDSSDYASSYTNSLFGMGSESMNSRNQIIEEPLEHIGDKNGGVYTMYNGIHGVNYSGNHGGDAQSMHHVHDGDGETNSADDVYDEHSWFRF
uniref:Uncharacterized protein n=1 Tax=Meloidogyne incognita TaxID=6306 RepID=A0A914KUN0_MELIC